MKGLTLSVVGRIWHGAKVTVRCELDKQGNIITKREEARRLTK